MFKFLLLDASYFLMRQFSVMKSTRAVVDDVLDENGEGVKDMAGDWITYYRYNFTAVDLATSIYWSVARLIDREECSCRKVILAFDKSPYHKSKFLDEYKGDRHYASEEDLEDLTFEDNPELYKQTQEEIRAEGIKRDAKAWIIENFPKLGFEVLSHPGYEADDLAYLFANYYKDDDEPSAICSVDSDWSYLINDNVVRVHPKKYTVTTPDDVYDDFEEYFSPEVLEKLDLYTYKSYYDSLYGSHNHLFESIDPGIDIDKVYKALLLGKGTVPLNKDLFSRQLKSFDVYSYPDIDIVLDKIASLTKSGSICPVEKYPLFRTLTHFGVSEDYYAGTIGCLDESLYSEYIEDESTTDS